MSLAYVVFLVLLTAQRLSELVIARRHVTSVPEPERGAPLESNAEYAVLVVLHVALLVAPPLEHVLARREPPALVVGLALAACLAAQALRLASQIALGRARTVRGERLPGTVAVTRGPYRFVRHPNYAAVLVEFVAVPAVGGAWIALVLLSLAHVPILARRVRREEAQLAQLPGWSATVGRLPRFLPRPGARPRS